MLALIVYSHLAVWIMGAEWRENVCRLLAFSISSCVDLVPPVGGGGGGEGDVNRRKRSDRWVNDSNLSK